MKLNELLENLNTWAPFIYSESYDNVGLIVGNKTAEIKGVLVNLDATAEVVEECAVRGANVLITHHPILFAGTKRILADGSQDSEVIRACIKNDINLVAMHTNLDAIKKGVNYKIGEKLGLRNMKILEPKSDLLRKLIFFCPVKASSEVLQKLYETGAGHIGNYDQCSFQSLGKGGFRPLEAAEPSIGTHGQREEVEEDRIELIYDISIQDHLIDALRRAHPYEEVAYDILPIENKNAEVGMGMIGNLEKPILLLELMDIIKTQFGQPYLSYTGANKAVQRIAYCGGSGSFLIETAMRCGVDVYITADIKYHDYFRVKGKMPLINMGHHEMEQFTSELIVEFLSKKNDTFAVHLSQVNTNPVHYY